MIPRAWVILALPGLLAAAQPGFAVGAATAVLVRTDDLGGPNDQLILSLRSTGIGRVTPADVYVHAGNARAEVLYAGPQGTYPGLDQINIRVPREAAGSGESGIVLAISGKTANVVTVNLK